jgi:inorganic pyrophosphatase
MFTTLAFLTGCITSIVSGWIGMKIATYANTRTAFMARYSLSEAF